MNRVYISIGSNQETVRHVRSALDALYERFGDLIISSVYESEAVGFDGENFLNLVVGLDTDEPLASLADWLKAVEDNNGRQRNVARYSSRTLDLDILTYGDKVGQPEGVELPRREILKNAFVLKPLAEIAPEELHPTEQRSYGALWNDYSRDQRLWAIPFEWRGGVISPRR
ncbi:2-amino-4-hydroxy-6-hydroxymethyldihydropteridine diphosphokinase [Halospina denitrificans]|uniref:2-amino-4-hydroxy-6-hydroxymethyldihydropteridine diphosphokinase n=1 Tax=Halospina denitrificans TaxID=332522 RepID=A0A4R7K284_9GAMM|nr:2-amino-4-hydroxy-6-hydroxymethyldihydropteridine diphosphokinase [Halospina denitrificans]TDT44586.1 2-amino-4-hydroxy-6-hydroxymethyldihydropteridine diphosphokinase [Halospina denitrificans]